MALDVGVKLVGLPNKSHALGNCVLDILLDPCYEHLDVGPGLCLLEAPLEGPDALDEGDGERVELVGLVGLVGYGQGDPEPQVLQVPHLLRKLDDLGQEVDSQLQGTPAPSPPELVDGKDPAGDPVVPLLNPPGPVVEDLLGVPTGLVTYSTLFG